MSMLLLSLLVAVPNEIAIDRAHTEYDRAVRRAETKLIKEYRRVIKLCEAKGQQAEANKYKDDLRYILGEELEGDTICIKGVTYSRGLRSIEYPMQKCQSLGKEELIPISLLRLRNLKPIGDVQVIDTIESWKHAKSHNKVVMGFLYIQVSGDYTFQLEHLASSGTRRYERYALYIGNPNIPLCKVGGRSAKVIYLRKGLVPIALVGYVGTRTVSVKWAPPGQNEFCPIPKELLFHRVGKLWEKKEDRKKKGALQRMTNLQQCAL